MKFQEFNTRTLTEGQKLDLTKNWPGYDRVVGEIVGSKGSKYLIKILVADGAGKLAVGDTITIAPNYVKRMPVVTESNDTVWIGKLASTGKIVRIVRKQHEVKFSDERDWLLIDTDPAKGNKAMGLKWIPADTRFDWVRPYKKTIDEDAVGDLAKDLKDPYSYDAIDHMMQTIARKHNITAKELHNRFVEKHGQIPDDWVKNLKDDYDPNGKPPGPEFKPTMPKGTVRVDVSDVYDWYKLGQHISNLKGLGKHDFGKGPPSTIFSFGSEDEEHKFINDLEKTGLTTTDIDPIDPDQPKGMKRQKTDPTFNVGENFADGKNPGRKGLAKRSGVDCKQSVTKLRDIAAHSSGERQRMAHWCANMKSGKNK